MKLSRARLILIVGLLAGAFARETAAKNVDLSTVPKRDSVQLTIYNSEDITLVRETRTVTFKKGANPLQFSWATPLIDPTAVEVKCLTQPDKLEVFDTTYPHDKPQMLYWNVQSEMDGEATIQFTYFTSGITWSADYLLVADKNEQQLSFDGFVRVSNNSGEEYADAQVRLVVGTINLVEKIAQLAQIKPGEVRQLAEDRRHELGLEAAAKSMEDNAARFGDAEAKEPQPKQVIKEGLSEYFIYTIEGTETIPNGWSKRMRSLQGQTVPFQIQYRYRPQEYGDQLVRMYLLTNNKESKLGASPLPDGAVWVYRDNGRDGLSYLAQQQVKYIPIGDKIELNLGVDPEVIFELIKLKAFRSDVWFQKRGTRKFLKLGDNAVTNEPNLSVVGWNDHKMHTQRVRNYTNKPIELEIRRPFDGHVSFRSSLNPKLHDYRTVEFTALVPPGERAALLFEICRRQGHNATQNNVTLETAEIKP